MMLIPLCQWYTFINSVVWGTISLLTVDPASMPLSNLVANAWLWAHTPHLLSSFDQPLCLRYFWVEVDNVGLMLNSFGSGLVSTIEL